jgi:acetyl esterase
MLALNRAVPFFFLLSMTTTTFSATGTEVRQGIEYANPGGVSLRLDASIPNSAAPLPAAIIVHGGGWVRGDRRVDVEPLFKPLSDAGMAWFSISYRLATDASQFGVAVNDVEAAIRFVKTHAAEFHINPSRIALIGESAGGQLASLAALGTSPDLDVKAVVALYTPSDLVSLVKGSTFVPQSIRDLLQGTPWEGLILGRLAQLSPIENVRPGMPPFLLIHGTADSLVPFEQSRAMCEKMRSVGAGCELYPVPGAGHGIRWWEASPSIAQPYKLEMVRWLKAQLTDRSNIRS